MSIGRLLAKFAKSLDANGTPSGAHEVGDLKWSARAAPSAKWLACDGAAYSRATYAALFAAIGTAYGAGDGSTTFNVPDYRGRGPLGAGAGEVVDTVAAAAVNQSANTITVPANADKWVTGMAVKITSTGTLPAPLSASSTYSVIRVDATTIQLANNAAAAIAGNAIDITTNGTGSHTLKSTLTTRARGATGGEESHVASINEIPAHTHPVGRTGDTNPASFGDGGSGVTVDRQITSTAGGDVNGPDVAVAKSVGGSAAHNNMQPYTASNVFIYAGV